MKKFISSFLIICSLLCIFSGCSKSKTSKEKFTDYNFEYFDTVTTIIGFEETQEDFDKNAKKIYSWIKEYHQLYDIYSSYEGITNLCTVNKSQGSEIKVDQKIIDLLLYSKDLYAKSNKLNVAMGSVLSIWHNYRTYGINNPAEAKLPSKEELENASNHTNLQEVVINQANGTVLIKDSLLLLDVGAIAKGYAAEKVAQEMKKADMNGYILNIGGNVKIVGDRPDGESWTVGIENPDTQSQDPYVETLSLGGDMSLVTSGSYQRFYVVDGKNYNHIIDSSTLYPAEYFASVSVLCENSALADGLSTTLFCLPYEDGKALVESMGGVYAMWITPGGQKLYSKGFKNYCN